MANYKFVIRTKRIKNEIKRAVKLVCFDIKKLKKKR